MSAEMIPLSEAHQKLSVIEVTEKFLHPYDDKSWLWRMCYKTKRFFFLVAVFLPCMTVAGLGELTGSEELRALGIQLLVKSFNHAGCGLQKFGQWLSMRPDMIPADVVAALSSLRQDVPPHNIHHTRRMLKESFDGLDIEDVFEEFDEEPVASGTVAQVHRARLRHEYALKADIRGPDGELIREVAVKVRHPSALAEMWCDVDMMYDFMRVSTIVSVPIKKEEFMDNMRRQLDFKWEAHNLCRFAENFQSEMKTGELRFPIVSVNMLSPCILLESWADGRTVGNLFESFGSGETHLVEELKDAGSKVKHVVEEITDELVGTISAELRSKKKELAETLFDMSIKMFLRDNLVHGDLHGGNVLFDEKTAAYTVIDAGLTTSLQEEVRQDFGRFLKALCTADVDAIIGHLLEFNEQEEVPRDAVAAAQWQESLTKDVKNAVRTCISEDGTTAPDGGAISLGDLVGEVMFSLQRHGVYLRGDVASSLMTMGVTEGLIRSLDPDYDMVAKALPYFIRYSDAL